MATTDGGMLFGKALKKEGVDCVFTLVGGHILPILYGCKAEGIRIVDNRHECAAGYAADAYAKVSGKPGVLITTAGPGVTNATTAMAEAAETGSPVVHIGGASPRIENETSPLQNVKSFEAMSAFCKWSARVNDAARVPEYVAMAFRHAMAGTPGPVYLEIPVDVLRAQQVDEDTVYWPENTKANSEPFGDPAMIEKAAEALMNAKRPAMFIGSTARYYASYGEYVEKLANHLQMPVLCTTAARGVFADETKNPLFTLGAGPFTKADVILELCPAHDYKVGKGRAPAFNGEALRIVASPDNSQIGYNAPANIGLVGGAGAVAKQLFEAISAKSGPQQSDAWLKEARALAADTNWPYAEAAISEIQPPHPGRVAAEVAKFIEEEAKDWHVVCDGGDSASWMDVQSAARFPGQVVRYGPLGTIGTGQGFTMGAHMATGKPVLYYTGDGSFGFYEGEFNTYVRNKVPMVCVISNDSAWGMIKLSRSPAELEKFGYVAVDLDEAWAYHELPKLWGGTGVLVDRYEDIIPAIRKVRDSGLPGIVNVRVDKTEMHPSTARFGGITLKRKT